MDLTEKAFLERQSSDIKLATSNEQSNQTSTTAKAIMIDKEQVSIMQEQLSLSTELEIIEHLLRSHVLRHEGNGASNWVEPTDKQMIILTEYGVQLIMNTITFYINKNTLLSNYTDELINQKMEDFSVSLADAIFMEYEKVFRYPTFAECKEVLTDRIAKKAELREFAMEQMGKKADNKKLTDEFWKEIENRIEKEITKIKEQIIKNKLKRFELIVREVQDAVHSTYLRAMNGSERSSIRKHIHISESTGGTGLQPNKPSKINPLNLFRH